MDPEKIYLEAKQRFIQTSAWVSLMSLLLMAASRIPALEVTSPVAWLSGSFNIVMISVLGPILIFGGFCWVCLSAGDLIDLQTALFNGRPSAIDPQVRDVLLRLPVIDALPYPTRMGRLSLRLVDGFVFGVPLLCYVVLFFGYLGLVRPVKPDSTEWAFKTRSGQIADLVFGIGGVQGFQPVSPSVLAALRQRSSDSSAKDAAQQTEPSVGAHKIANAAGEMPWIYPPWQTWAYLGGFAILCVVAFSTWRTGQQSAAASHRKRAATKASFQESPDDAI